MLTLTIADSEYFDDLANNGDGLFKTITGGELYLEHSLVALSKWESFYEAPFLGNKELGANETRYYIECMCLGDNPRTDLIPFIKPSQLEEIQNYISRKHTATWFNDTPTSETKTLGKEKVITSELIYSWMINYGIPFSCETWNVNRLITLIRVCQVDSQGDKMSSSDRVSQMQELNRRRRAQSGSGG